MADKLELENNTDVLLLETGDALLLEFSEAITPTPVEDGDLIGIAVIL